MTLLGNLVHRARALVVYGLVQKAALSGPLSVHLSTCAREMLTPWRVKVSPKTLPSEVVLCVFFITSLFDRLFKCSLVPFEQCQAD